MVLYFAALIWVCEYLVYYFTLYSCNWPDPPNASVKNIRNPDTAIVNLMVLADTHLVGYVLGHPIDRIRRFESFIIFTNIYMAPVVVLLHDLKLNVSDFLYLRFFDK